MKVLFVSANREESNMSTYPLGLACVAEATKQAGHDVERVDLMGANDPSSVLEDAIHRFRRLRPRTPRPQEIREKARHDFQIQQA